MPRFIAAFERNRSGVNQTSHAEDYDANGDLARFYLLDNSLCVSANGVSSESDVTVGLNSGLTDINLT